MKRINYLYEQISEPNNLRLAFLKASRGKRNRAEVIRYRENLGNNLAQLRYNLLNEQIEVGNYRFFKVLDPKERTICAAAFPERVLHHAVMNIVEPQLERYSIFDSYACRNSKGQHAALARAQQFCRQSSWYLKLDIRKYFDHIDHACLLHLLARRFKDQHLLALFATCLDSYSTVPGRGLPIGNLLSQHLANFYLGALDHFLKDDKGVKGYLRYMDDFVLFGSSREQLKTLLKDIKFFLHEKIHLELKDNIQLNRCELGVPLLGFRVYPQKIRLDPRSRNRFSTKLRASERDYIAGRYDEQDLVRLVTPLVAFVQFADTKGFRHSIISDSRLLIEDCNNA